MRASHDYCLIFQSRFILFTIMALYTALDFEGPFLKQLLEHFRKQQKDGEGVDLHLIADNPEDKMSLHQVD